MSAANRGIKAELKINGSNGRIQYTVHSITTLRLCLSLYNFNIILPIKPEKAYLFACSISCTDINNFVGDMFGTFIFVVLICFLNFHNFNPKSFCLMNPREKLCDMYREELSCKNQIPLDPSGMGHFYADYAGFFKSEQTGKVIYCLSILGDL